MTATAGRPDGAALGAGGPELADAPFADDLATLWYRVRRVASAMDRAGETLFREGLGLTLAQFLVLSVVDAHPGAINQQAIADRIGLTKSAVSRQLDGAVAAGWMTVTVSPTSRRDHVVALTPQGTALVRRGDDLLARVRADSGPALDPADLSAALRVLEALDRSLR